MYADAGNALGMTNYGVTLENSYSGETDLLEAMRYYKMSADAENTQAKTLFENLSKRMN
jgi:TPR repeat protein